MTCLRGNEPVKKMARISKTKDNIRKRKTKNFKGVRSARPRKKRICIEKPRRVT